MKKIIREQRGLLDVVYASWNLSKGVTPEFTASCSATQSTEPSSVVYFVHTGLTALEILRQRPF